MMSGAAGEPGAGGTAPQLTIVVYPNGGASVGGVPVTVPDGADLAAVRHAAISTAVDLAAQHGRPLRALALEPDGSAWPLVIHPDGRVEEDEESDGAAPPSGTPGAPRAAGRVIPTLNLAAIPPTTRGPRTQTVILNQQWSEVVETPPAPERFRERLARIAEAGESGRTEAAMTLAADLEREVVLLFGPSHPHALQARAVSAHINTLARDWVRAADKYLAVATAWADMPESRSAQVRRNALNAHYCWRRVEDAGEAERIGEAVVRIWLKLPGALAEVRAARRHRDRIRNETS
ncbi:hypothetical protein [Streptomyces alanosinicus]|uniref:Uncharacterized protein n=1 Tax=Streptomyces alanosinicus TaxID=68171 RepID=A0A919D5W7_9ACTN|nr:hypothetical protein [Streptomyces alanosinicus]GHE07337.1 hypothetical protein GCM10010339_52030 [Streptomyces alanosinicus]